MSIYLQNLEEFKQDFSCKKGNKEKYGEVNTDFILVNRILDLLPTYLFDDPTLKWLDPCTGKGYFSMILYKRLFKSLQTKIKAPKKRHQHIIKNMIYMVELNSDHIPTLYKIFGNTANIANDNFLEMKNMHFDIIIGNPPFNANGLKKVPTNKLVSKKEDGVVIWADFIKISLQNLKQKGWLAMITPSIWLKRDHRYHRYLMDRGEILKLHCMTNTETNKIFHKQAQTPTTYFSFYNNLERKGHIKIFDYCSKSYISCNTLNSMPLISPKIIQKLGKFVRDVGHLKVIKTSMRPGYKGLSVKKEFVKKTHEYPNISTCILEKSNPRLVINYTNKECSFATVKPKLVLAHKMYGFPYYDMKGYGISNRDNYVIKDYTPKELLIIKQLLTTKLAFVIFESTRYRMKYLEKYAFEFIPDITKLSDFPMKITDETVAEYFKFDILERNYINTFIKKKYSQFI